MKTKIIIMLACLGVILFLPKMTLADISLDDFDFDVDVSDDGWNINVGSDDSGGGGGLSGDSYGLPKGSILGIVDNILMWMLGILSAVALIGFIISGIMYLTAAGDETQAGKAKKAMLYSIIGVIVGLSGFVIYQAAMYMLNGQSF